MFLRKKTVRPDFAEATENSRMQVTLKSDQHPGREDSGTPWSPKKTLGGTG